MAINFTAASSQYVQLVSQNNLPQVGGPITVSLWFKYTTVPVSGNQGYYCQRDVVSAVLDRTISLGHRSGSVGAWKTGGTFLVSTAAPSANVWHNLVYTCDGANNNKLYLDGVEVNTSATATDASSGGMVQTTFACTHTIFGGRAEYFQGDLDDIRVYAAVLGLAEIQAIYFSNGIDNIVRSLVGRWTMNEGASGSVASGADAVRDLSNQGNHSTANASPLYSESDIILVRATGC